MVDILEIKDSCSKVLAPGEKVEVIEVDSNLGYNYEATIRFFIEDTVVADSVGGDNIGWKYEDLYGYYFEEITDVLRVRHHNWERKVCPECDGTNLNEDKTRCWDCDGGPG